MFFWAGGKRKFIPSWIWILIFAFPILILIRWLVWWFFCPSHERTESLEIDAPRSDSISMNQKKDDFSLLKGIGPKTARKIVEYRERHGPFHQISDLKNVRGIGPKKMAILSPFLTVTYRTNVKNKNVGSGLDKVKLERIHE